MTRPTSVGILAAVLTLVADQASKLWLLFVDDLVGRGPVALTSFLDLTPVWNRGISYGLFQQDGEVGRLVLIGLSLAASVGLAIWMVRAETRWLAAALGLIVGGALGNAIDRIAYGAVFDFVHLHVGTFSWYVFNVADAAIVAGVVGLLYDSFVPEAGRQAPATATPPQESPDGGSGREQDRRGPGEVSG